MGNPVMHFQLCAEDVDAMSAFYRDVFGWRIAPRRLTSVEADVSGSYPYDRGRRGRHRGRAHRRDRRRRGAVLVSRVDDIEATLARVEAAREAVAGIRRTPPERMEMADAEGPATSFDLAEFEDREGNVVQISSR